MLAATNSRPRSIHARTVMKSPYYLLTSGLLVLLFVSSASGGIRPSFSPEASGWRATDIVVVTEGGEIDGVLKILETWKGDLKPGQTIIVPELAEFRTDEARSVDKSWDSNPKKELRYVTGQRMILFLRDSRKIS